jgi:hypothetical protein
MDIYTDIAEWKVDPSLTAKIVKFDDSYSIPHGNYKLNTYFKNGQNLNEKLDSKFLDEFD